MDLGPPFWNQSTPPPQEGEKIGKYVVIESVIPDPTNCSYIYSCLDTDDNQKKVIKFIKFIERKISRISSEVETLNSVHHPFIIQMEKCFRYKEYMCIVIPYVPNGSLHRLMVTDFKEGMTESMAAVIMYQMLSAVRYLHSMNIWHRDIKPDNFLVVDSDPFHPVVVLNDFGYAKIFNSDEKGHEFMGTPEFLPPEIVNGIPYDNTVDTWSLGITLFVMLTCRYPTPSYSKYPTRCKKMISKGILNFQLLNEMEISNEAIDLVHKMCMVDPESRITLTEALLHPWVRSRNKTEVENEVASALYAGEEYEYEFGNYT